MGTIDWNKLYQATSKENRPTPGYLFNDIIRNISYANPQQIPAVAEYLADCVDGDHAHVKLKALFVIKSLAYRVPPFCESMQERLASVQEAASFSGPPSALFGDEPYRLVREAAEGAISALTGGEHYHEQYREMSRRIVGFGNFQPGEDTILPDGSVNMGRDVGVKDIALGAVGLIQSGVGAVLGGVKDMLSNPFGQKKMGLGALGHEDEDDELGGAYDEEEENQDPNEQDGTTDEDGCYRPSAGSYVPPTVPLPAAATQGGQEQEPASGLRLEDLDAVGSREQTLRPSRVDPSIEMLGQEQGSDQDEASFMRLLGLEVGGGLPGANETGSPALSVSGHGSLGSSGQPIVSLQP
mmetsp:Transcript_92329/g.214550  ORF Transcript_92329/g.214550 Transcript_92329/m.214550 type:complete len:354 (+) Transcript_92329:93-1154(+)